MLARIYSCAVVGLEGVIVEVEVDTTQGFPGMDISCPKNRQISPRFLSWNCKKCITEQPWWFKTHEERDCV